MLKILVAHRRDEAACRKHLFAFKKVFPNFIYCNLDSIKPSSLILKVEEVEYNGTIKDTQQEEPQKLRGG
jgi:hypothetical protein